MSITQAAKLGAGVYGKVLVRTSAYFKGDFGHREPQCCFLLNSNDVQQSENLEPTVGIEPTT